MGGGAGPLMSLVHVRHSDVSYAVHSDSKMIHASNCLVTVLMTLCDLRQLTLLKNAHKNE